MRRAFTWSYRSSIFREQLSFSTLFPGNNRITDSAVKAIAKSCPELRHVFIADSPRLTDLALKALSGCKYLIVLNIADCVRYALGQKI